MVGLVEGYMAVRTLTRCRREQLGGKSVRIGQILDAVEALGWEAASYSEDGQVLGIIVGTAEYVEDMSEAMMLAFGTVEGEA